MQPKNHGVNFYSIDVVSETAAAVVREILTTVSIYEHSGHIEGN